MQEQDFIHIVLRNDYDQASDIAGIFKNHVDAMTLADRLNVPLTREYDTHWQVDSYPAEVDVLTMERDGFDLKCWMTPQRDVEVTIRPATLRADQLWAAGHHTIFGQRWDWWRHDDVTQTYHCIGIGLDEERLRDSLSLHLAMIEWAMTPDAGSVQGPPSPLDHVERLDRSSRGVHTGSAMDVYNTGRRGGWY